MPSPTSRMKIGSPYSRRRRSGSASVALDYSSFGILFMFCGAVLASSKTERSAPRLPSIFAITTSSLSAASSVSTTRKRNSCSESIRSIGLNQHYAINCHTVVRTALAFSLASHQPHRGDPVPYPSPEGKLERLGVSRLTYLELVFSET